MFLDENNMAVQAHDLDHHHDDEPEEAVAARASAQHEARTFNLPASVWGIMMTSYAIFFGALAIAMGHDRSAIFVVAVSILFALMYFGTTFALNSLSAAGRKDEKRDWVKGKFETLGGTMSYGDIFGQMLVLPILFALFGIAVIIIRSVVM